MPGRGTGVATGTCSRWMNASPWSIDPWGSSCALVSVPRRPPATVRTGSVATTPIAAATGARPCYRISTASSISATRRSRSGRQATRSLSFVVLARIALVLTRRSLKNGCGDLLQVILDGRIHRFELETNLPRTAGLDELRQIKLGEEVVAGL